MHTVSITTGYRNSDVPEVTFYCSYLPGEHCWTSGRCSAVEYLNGSGNHDGFLTLFDGDPYTPLRSGQVIIEWVPDESADGGYYGWKYSTVETADPEQPRRPFRTAL